MNYVIVLYNSGIGQIFFAILLGLSADRLVFAIVDRPWLGLLVGTGT